MGVTSDGDFQFHIVELESSRIECSHLVKMRQQVGETRQWI